MNEVFMFLALSVVVWGIGGIFVYRVRLAQHVEKIKDNRERYESANEKHNRVLRYNGQGSQREMHLLIEIDRINREYEELLNESF